MATLSPYPTPYPDVNAVLRALLSDARTILGTRFLGMYLSGSLAMGDFDGSSDVDVLVLTSEALPKAMVSALATMHERLAANYPRWGTETEVSYVPRSAVRRYDPAHDLHPYIGRGESLRMEEHRREWDIHRYVIRERGIVVEGPAPRTFIDPVGPDAVRGAVLETLREWWPLHFHDPAELHPRGYRSYIVLTGCRILYTLDHGTVASKPVAARWAQDALGTRWAALIEWALAARRDPRSDELDNLNETLDFVRYTIEHGRRFGP